MIHIKRTITVTLWLLSASVYAGRFVVTPEEEYDTKDVRKISFEQKDRLLVSFEDGQSRSYDFSSFHRIYFSEGISTEEKPPMETAEFYLYPNPVSEVLFLRGVPDHSAYELYDLRGLRIQDGVSENEEIQMPVSHLTNGCYFLKVDGKVLRFVKK
ncbi:MAG: T9SS type A sorting domain-containing protein [Paludibacteraceae bacterium]|nr:T9SS type A sorting domain-containing protein [Paludibacteraceae bacterium]